jgi:hypothetical protein
MNTTTAEILTELIAEIEAVAPYQPASPDDRFRARIGQRVALRGSRAVVLSAAGGRRINAGRTCSDYESEITIDVFYVDAQGRSLIKAIADSEAILEALYTWSVTNALGVARIEPDLAVASLLDESDLVMTRTLRVVFEYGNGV